MKRLLVSIMIVINSVLAFSPALVSAQGATSVCDSITTQVDPGATCTKASGDQAVGGVLKTVLQTLVYIIGTISVLVIVIGGLMYVVSAGSPDNTRRAKDAILYAIIGIIIALLAQAIVSFILTRVG